jgi:hypothetical protein
MGSRRKCCCAGTTFCVSVICPSQVIKLVGAVVMVAGKSCTIGTSGCCTIDGLSGTQTVTVTYDGVTIFTGSRAMGSTVNIVLSSPPAGFVCCWNCLIPETLYLTDANGTHTLSWTGVNWYICYTIATTGVTLAGTTGCGCLCGAPGPITLPIQYQVVCSSTVTNSFLITAEWPGVCCVGGTGCVCGGGCSAMTPGVAAAGYVQPSNGCNVFSGGYTSDCSLCSSGTSNPFIDALSVTQAWSRCSPFALSGTLAGTTLTSSPVGTSISISS